jgi:hypothetical protein
MTEPLTRSPHVRETHNQDGAVLLDPRRGKLFPLNPVAALIWKQVGEGFTPEQIANNVAIACSISVEVANGDVSEFLQLVVAEQLAFPHTTVKPELSRPNWWRRLRDRTWARFKGSSEAV